jgi:polo-like kinase 1
LTTSDLFRPTVDIVLNDEFMTCGYMPTRLPLSCLIMAPRFDAKLNSSIIAVRRPLGEVNRVHLPGTAEHPQGSFNTHAQHFVADFDLVTFFSSGEGSASTNELNHGEDAGAAWIASFAVYTAGPAPKQLLLDLQQQLTRFFSAKPSEKFPLMMGTYIKYFCMNTITLICSDFPSQMRQRIQDQFL